MKPSLACLTKRNKMFLFVSRLSLTISQYTIINLSFSLPHVLLYNRRINYSSDDLDKLPYFIQDQADTSIIINIRNMQ